MKLKYQLSPTKEKTFIEIYFIHVYNNSLVVYYIFIMVESISVNDRDINYL